MDLLHRKTAKKLIMGMGIVAIFIPLFDALFITPEDTQQVQATLLPKATMHDTNVVSLQSSASTQPCNSISTDVPRLRPDELRLAPGILEGGVQVDRLIQESHSGDENATLALFFVVQSCAPYRDYITTNDVISDDSFAVKHDICTYVPTKLIYDPLAILDTAAKNGSIRAQIVYARNALPVLKYKTFLNPEISADEKAIIVKKAEAYAIEAAKAGASSAFEILANAYETGLFGKQDLPRSYVYMSALSRTGLSDNAISRTNELYRSMTRDDVMEAAKMMQPCPAQKAYSFGALHDLF